MNQACHEPVQDVATAKGWVLVMVSAVPGGAQDITAALGTVSLSLSEDRDGFHLSKVLPSSIQPEPPDPTCFQFSAVWVEGLPSLIGRQWAGGCSVPCTHI